MKSQLLFLFPTALVLLVGISSLDAIDPGFVIEAFGIRVDTLPLIRKLETALHTIESNTKGRQIRFKPSSACLDATYYEGESRNLSRYIVSVARCNATEPAQHWRLDATRFEVASEKDLPHVAGVPCLNTWDYRENASYPDNVSVEKCSGGFSEPSHSNSHQSWYLRIHQTQLNLVEKRVYFSIHHFTSKCLTTRFEDSYNIDTLYLAECTGSNEQSFYLDDSGSSSSRISFSNEFSQITSQLRS